MSVFIKSRKLASVQLLFSFFFFLQGYIIDVYFFQEVYAIWLFLISKL